MKRVAVALLCLLSFDIAKADEVSMISHGFSKHLDNHNFNERPVGAGIRYEHDDFGLQAGGFRNSVNKNSFYAGIDWVPFRYTTNTCFSIDAGPFYGFATGYKFDITPLIGLQSSIKCDNMFARVRIMPDPYYNSKGIGAIEFGVVVKRF